MEGPAIVNGADGANTKERATRSGLQHSNTALRREVDAGHAHAPRAQLPPSAAPVIHVGPPQPSVHLPNIGEVYWVAGYIQDPQDRKGGRYSVVVSVPRTSNGRITIITRTTRLKRPGVPSPKGTPLRFSEPGVWGHRRTVEGHLWRPPDVSKKRGQLDQTTLGAVMAYFRIRGYQT